jgi:hypothetical protein
MPKRSWLVWRATVVDSAALSRLTASSMPLDKFGGASRSAICVSRRPDSGVYHNISFYKRTGICLWAAIYDTASALGCGCLIIVYLSRHRHCEFWQEGFDSVILKLASSLPLRVFAINQKILLETHRPHQCLEGIRNTISAKGP